MKIFLLAFTFLALFSFNANAGDNSSWLNCKVGNETLGNCNLHYHQNSTENYFTADIHYTFRTKKNYKQTLITIRHLMHDAKKHCSTYNNKDAYLFINEEFDRVIIGLGTEVDQMLKIAESSIYFICGHNERDALDNVINMTSEKLETYPDYYKFQVLVWGDEGFKPTLPSFEGQSYVRWYPTHFYKNEYLPRSQKYKVESDYYTSIIDKQKIIADKSAKEEKAKKLQPLKDDCKDLGFTENTEAMGNCMLKLMELKQSTNSSGQSQSSDDTSVSEWLGIANDGINMMNDNSSSSQTCFKTGEVKQAFNKICEYKCGLTTYTTNLGTGVGLCPSTIQR